MKALLSNISQKRRLGEGRSMKTISWKRAKSKIHNKGGVLKGEISRGQMRSSSLPDNRRVGRDKAYCLCVVEFLVRRSKLRRVEQALKSYPRHIVHASRLQGEKDSSYWELGDKGFIFL